MKPGKTVIASELFPVNPQRAKALTQLIEASCLALGYLVGREYPIAPMPAVVLAKALKANGVDSPHIEEILIKNETTKV